MLPFLVNVKIQVYSRQTFEEINLKSKKYLEYHSELAV
jgi:hypothetical protein